MWSQRLWSVAADQVQRKNRLVADGELVMNLTEVDGPMFSSSLTQKIYFRLLLI